MAELLDETDKKIESNFVKLEENPDENLKKILFNGIEEKDITENLMDKTLLVYKQFKLEEQYVGINIIKSIFSAILNFSKFNFNKRAVDFFDFILSIPTLNFTYLKKSFEYKNG